MMAPSMSCPSWGHRFGVRAGWRGQEEERCYIYREADGGSWRHGVAEVRRWARLEMNSRRRRKLSSVMVALMAERPAKVGATILL